MQFNLGHAYFSDVFCVFASRLFTIFTQSMIRHAFCRQTGPQRRVDSWPCNENFSGKCFTQGHNNTSSISGIELRIDNLTVAYLRSYPLSNTAK